MRGQYAHDGAMQSIVFADGVTWTQEMVMQKLLDLQSAANGGSIWGYSGRNDVLAAGLGDKYMAGQGGGTSADLINTNRINGKKVTVQREWAKGGPLQAITFSDDVSWSQADVMKLPLALSHHIPPAW